MSLWKTLKSLFSTPQAAVKHSQLEDLQRLIGYSFHQKELLSLGLTHRSVAHSTGGSQPSNERLEFLGDSVLGLIIADQLYCEYPDASEGRLTKLKAMLVNETTLSQIAIGIGLNEYVLMSSEEEKSGGRERASIMSDAFESIIGAVYLDGGLEAARKLVLRCIYSRYDSIVSDAALRNFKGDLLELTQARGQGMPQYDIASEVGPDHDKTFHVVVHVNGHEVGEGSGASKKEAEQNAACTALKHLTEKNR